MSVIKWATIAFLGVMIGLIVLTLFIQPIMEKAQRETFCPGADYGAGRLFCDGKEFVCNTKKCWWVLD